MRFELYNCIVPKNKKKTKIQIQIGTIFTVVFNRLPRQYESNNFLFRAFYALSKY